MEDGRTGSNQPFPTFAEPRIGDMDETGGLGTPRLASFQQLPRARMLAMEIARGSEGEVMPNDALDLLCRREIIEPSGSGYKFQVELIRRWFARSRVQ